MFKHNKFGNKRTTVGELTFDSKLEARHYAHLHMLERAGEISHLELQPCFELQPSFKKNGLTIRAIKYIADFMYVNKEGETVVEDVKSAFTAKDPLFRLKKKLFEYKYPHLTLTEVYK